MKPRSATHSRREFLQLAGTTALVLSAMRRADAELPDFQHKEAHMEIKRSGSQPSSKGPADWFTGAVRIDPLFPPNAPARAAGNAVTFEPGARTAWHTHPLGQSLIITAGHGRVQRGGWPVVEIRP